MKGKSVYWVGGLVSRVMFERIPVHWANVQQRTLRAGKRQSDIARVERSVKDETTAINDGTVPCIQRPFEA